MTARKRRQYGTGTVTKRANGRWYGLIEAGYTTTGGRRRVSVSAKTEAECKRKLRDKQLEIQQAGAAATGSRVTVKRYAEDWEALTVTTLRPNAYTANASALRQWIIPTIGHRRLAQLTPADVRAVQSAQRIAGRKPSTMLRTHVVLISMLKAAQQDGHQIAANVLTTKGPTKGNSDREDIPVDHALRILQAASELPHGSRWMAPFFQGMRQGECLGLTWEQVDLERGLLVVSWQLQSLPYSDRKAQTFRVPDGYEAHRLHGAYHLVRPKSQQGWRLIPLAPWFRDALAAWQPVAPANDHGLVWPTLKGKATRKHVDNDEWRALQGTAEVGHPAGRYWYEHEARHTTATLLLELGVDQHVVTAILGHSSIVTSRGYQHVKTDLARQAMEAVAERLQLPA